VLREDRGPDHAQRDPLHPRPPRPEVAPRSLGEARSAGRRGPVRDRREELAAGPHAAGLRPTQDERASPLRPGPLQPSGRMLKGSPIVFRGTS
jgi:hypothetical protein